MKTLMSTREKTHEYWGEKPHGDLLAREKPRGDFLLAKSLKSTF